MDAALLHLAYKRTVTPDKKEGFEVKDTQSWFLVLVSIFIGLPAAYLSWTSNAAAGWGVIPRIIFALFAFTFCVSYLVAHLLHKADLLAALRKA
jgi:sterol desaturase/sphingolipid hydroxylase (fatty acid hydroxylase superfamily)